ncbi:hypothetical protein JYK21_21885 [Ralstonia pickettii]|nr:hypothetical protein [Ralstonia pickettii]
MFETYKKPKEKTGGEKGAEAAQSRHTELSGMVKERIGHRNRNLCDLARIRG